VPSSRSETTSDRSASRALPPALRMTFASPSARPRMRAGTIRAFMHVTTATGSLGGAVSSPWRTLAA
jgi:hypothetical protein